MWGGREGGREGWGGMGREGGKGREGGREGGRDGEGGREGGMGREGGGKILAGALKVLIGVNLVQLTQPFDRDTWSSLVS